MTDLNSVQLGGRVTKAVAIEKTQSGLDMIKFSIAVNRSVKNKESNQYSNKVTFVDMVLFGKYAVSMSKYLKKGTYITAQGYLDMDSWTDKDGKKLSRLKFVPEQGKINPWVGVKSEQKNNSDNQDTSEIEAQSFNDDFIY